MNTPGNSHTLNDSQQMMAPEPPHLAQDQACDEILHGFELEDVPQPSSHEGHGHHICKPSAYNYNICKGQGVASTHQNDPILPTGLQAPEHIANLTVLEEVDDSHVNEGQSFKYMMATAVQTLRTNLLNISQVQMQTNGTNPYAASLSNLLHPITPL